MTGEAIVAALTEISSIEGSSNINMSRTLGEILIVGKSFQEGDLGLLFDCETILSKEFVMNNNLSKYESLNKDAGKVGFFSDKPRVRPLRMRGLKCSAFWIPVSSLSYAGDYSSLKEGDVLTSFNGKEICKKYVPKRKATSASSRIKSALENRVPDFKEHFSTDTLMRGLSDMDTGTEVIITHKMHGTSVRFGLTKEKSEAKSLFRRLLDAFTGKLSVDKYVEVSGSRASVRTISEDQSYTKGSSTPSDIYSAVTFPSLSGRLNEGETVYGELVGFNPSGSPIMQCVSSNEVKDVMSKEEYKEFVLNYGIKPDFSYGSAQEKAELFVYRITLTDAVGNSVDLGWDTVKARCAKLGVKHVAEITRAKVARFKQKDGTEITGLKYDRPLSALFEDKYLDYCGKPDTVRAIRDAGFELLASEYASSETKYSSPKEGICVRAEGYPSCKIYKHKSFLFRALEAALKDKGIVTVEEMEDNNGGQ